MKKDILSEFLNVSADKIIKYSDSKFFYKGQGYLILSFQEVNNIYIEFRKLCYAKITSHIPEEYHKYINYPKYYADCLYESYEYNYLESMEIFKDKFKIGRFQELSEVGFVL